jgi:sugar phosphate isomerase/epimerase
MLAAGLRRAQSWRPILRLRRPTVVVCDILHLRFLGRKGPKPAILEMGGQVHALHVGRWHMHFVIGYMQVPLSEIVKATKEAVRVGLGYRRAIWAAGYDKRFCFDARSLVNRIEYVRKHNLEDGLPLDPWDFIVLSSFLSER